MAPAHTSAAAVAAAASTPTAAARRPAAATSASASASPANSPMSNGRHPSNVYSPRICPPRAAPATATATAVAVRTARNGRLAAMADADWAVRTADTIDAVVGLVRDRAVVPVTTAARWAVYGAVAAIAGVTALVLLAVGLVRALDVATGAGNVWVAHLVAGGLFFVPGVFCLRTASRRRS